MAQQDEILGYDEFYEEEPTQADNLETDNFGEKIDRDEQVETDSSTELEEDRQDGPIDNMTDKAKEFGEDVKDKFR